MTWESRLISDNDLAAYAPQPITDFPSRVTALIHHQLATWPMLRNATDALEQVQYKELNINGSRVLAQFNPARIVSTAAKVDAASIQARPCFLCAENLPVEEKGVPFGDNYVALCNPFPVLKDHLVISERRHTPQAIAPCIEDLLHLTAALGSDYFTLYNGPACGASAPDHHHFQACSSVGVPLFDEIQSWPRTSILQQADLEVFSLTDYRLKILVASGKKIDTMTTWFEKTLTSLAKETVAGVEPMLNLVATSNSQKLTLYLFPRGKHRPSCYYAEGDQKLTISPAGIDLTGILVIPDPDHFARITAEAVTKIYSEITLEI